MGFRSVVWTSFDLLSCAMCAPADAVICLRSGDKLIGANGITTLSVQITNFERFRDGCGREFYRYTFSYDETLLVPGETILPGDVSGAFCKGCLTKWVEDQFNRVPFVMETSFQGIIDVEDSSTEVRPANAARRGGWVKNISVSEIYVSFSDTAVAGEPTLVEPGNVLLMGIAGTVVYQGEITAIHAVAGQIRELEVVEF